MPRQGIYVRHNSEYDDYYVGQTVNLQQRYDRQEWDEVVMFKDVEDCTMLSTLEQEAIEFCKAVGLPITNVKGNR